MHIEDENRLKNWISHVVEDISDAEPDALAKYVIALVKKPLSDADLEKLCGDKLNVFLQSHTESFVSQLFSTLKSGKYMTQTYAVQEQKQAVQIEVPQRLDEKNHGETEELVLTDGESEHEQEQEKEEEQQPTSTTKSTDTTRKERTVKESAQKMESSSSVRQSSVKEVSSSSSRRGGAVTTTTKDASLVPAKPPRKRISPPRSTSAERRAERERRGASPPARRRVILGGTGRGSGGRTMLTVERENRHYRSSSGQTSDRARGRSPRSKSRSPHRKEKRLSDLELRSSSSRRHRCRDFHEKGFCMRGDNCPFDHGPDPVVVENSALKDIVRDGATMFDATSAYGVNPPPPGLESTATAPIGKPLVATTTEGYNPEAPAMDPLAAAVPHIDFSVPPPPLPHIIHQRAQLGAPQLIYPPGSAPILPPYSAATTIVQIRPIGQEQIGTTLSSANTGTSNMYGTAQQVIGGQFGSGNGMVMRGGRFKPYGMANRNSASRSLLVKKIPPEMNKIAQLDQHFGRFGQVNNIQVQYEGRHDTALVTFKTRRDAMMAYKSTEPIFNNRFIKVFWQNDANAAAADGGQQEGETENGNAMNAGEQPTIPLSVGADQRLPIRSMVYPRYAKVFVQPKKEGQEGNPPADEPPEGEENKTASADRADELPSQTGPTELPVRPIYNPKAAAAKRRAEEKNTLSKLAELQKMKTDLYGKLLEQQTQLLKKLQQTAEKETKQKMIELLKNIDGRAKSLKAELEELGKKMREMQVKSSPKRPRLASLAAARQTTMTGNGSPAAAEDSAQPGLASPKQGTPNKKLLKLCRVVYVSGCTPELTEKLIVHMERFGELFDYDTNAQPRQFTYKDPLDAQKAVAEAANSFTLTKLNVEWAPVAKGVKSEQDIVPDGERKPSEQVTPKDLLASLDYDEDEEEEEKKNAEDDDGEE